MSITFPVADERWPYAFYRSWESPKAREYRSLNAFDDLLGTAVKVQAMVFGNAGGESGSGVAFTRNPATGTKALYRVIRRRPNKSLIAKSLQRLRAAPIRVWLFSKHMPRSPHAIPRHIPLRREVRGPRRAAQVRSRSSGERFSRRLGTQQSWRLSGRVTYVPAVLVTCTLTRMKDKRSSSHSSTRRVRKKVLPSGLELTKISAGKLVFSRG